MTALTKWMLFSLNMSNLCNVWAGIPAKQFSFSIPLAELNTKRARKT